MIEPGLKPKPYGWRVQDLNCSIYRELGSKARIYCNLTDSSNISKEILHQKR